MGQRYMLTLFRAKAVSLFLVKLPREDSGAVVDVRSGRLFRLLCHEEGEDHVHVVTLEDFPIVGLAGAAVESPERSFSVHRPQDDKAYDRGLDLSTETNDEVIHTVPIRADPRDGHGNHVIAVFQWRSDVSQQIFGDDGLFKAANMRHRDIMDKICGVVRISVQRWLNSPEVFANAEVLETSLEKIKTTDSGIGRRRA